MMVPRYLGTTGPLIKWLPLWLVVVPWAVLHSHQDTFTLSAQAQFGDDGRREFRFFQIIEELMLHYRP